MIHHRDCLFMIPQQYKSNGCVKFMYYFVFVIPSFYKISVLRESKVYLTRLIRITILQKFSGTN